MKRKNKCELIMMIFNATPWGYSRPNHCLNENWKQMYELSFLITIAGKGYKTRKDKPAIYFFVSPQKGTSLDGGPFIVEHWL